MKKLLQVLFGLSLLMMFSCEDPAEEMFDDMQNKNLKEGAVSNVDADIDYDSRPPR